MYGKDGHWHISISSLNMGTIFGILLGWTLGYIHIFFKYGNIGTSKFFNLYDCRFVMDEGTPQLFIIMNA